MTSVAGPPAAVAGIVERDSPYQGLVPYADTDHAYFFGRNAWRRVVVDFLQAYRISLFYGASGVGKSSILRAGVTHHLRELSRASVSESGTAEFAVVEFATWQGDALRAFTSSLTASYAALSPDLARNPPDGSLADVLRAWSDRISSHDSDVRALNLIILDQFEEYFVYHRGEPGPGAFATELIEALERRDVPANVLISIREDALDKLDRLEPDLSGVYDHLLRFEHLDREAAREAIAGPVRRWSELTGESVDIEPDLVNAVLDQVRTGRVRFGERGQGRLEDQGTAEDDGFVEAPYLQLVMMRLWEEERRQGSPLLRAETLRRLGGAERIVRRHLDDTLAALPRRERTTAARLFSYLVTPDERKIAVPATALAKWTKRNPRRVETVLKKLSGGDQRILRSVAAPGDDATSYEIFHDRLAGGVLEYAARYRQRRLWKRWGAVGLLLLLIAAAIVAGLARRNAQQASDISQLNDIVSTRDLKTVLRGHTGRINSVSFSPDGAKIVTASTDGTTRLWNAASGRAVLVLRSAGGAVDSALYALPRVQGFSSPTVVTVGTAFEVWNATDGRRQTSLTVVHQPSAIATVLGSSFVSATNLHAGRLVLVRVGHRDPRSPYPLRRKGPPANDAVRSYVEGQAVVAEAGGDGAVRVYTYPAAKLPNSVKAPLHPYSAGRSPLTHVTLNGDATLIAASGLDRRVTVWTSRGKWRFATRVPSDVSDLQFSADSQLLAVAENASVRLLSTRFGRLFRLFRCGNSLVEIAFSPDGRLLAAGCSDGIHVWDTRTWKPVATLVGGGDNEITALAFSPDGELLVGGTADGTTQVWITPAKADLALDSTSVGATGQPGTMSLRIRVRNRGVAAAGATSLKVVIPHQVPLFVDVPALGPGAVATVSTLLRFKKDQSGETLTLSLTLDPQRVVDEVTRRNDVQELRLRVPG